jgi:hypothetical protein
MRDYLRSKLVVAGIVVLILGSAPLLFIIIAAKLGLWPDPDPNPVGPGIIFFFTFWPSIICIIIGAERVSRNRREERLKRLLSSNSTFN